MKSAFWDVTPCSPIDVHIKVYETLKLPPCSESKSKSSKQRRRQHVNLLLTLKMEAVTFLRNVGEILLDYKLSHPRRQQSWYSNSVGLVNTLQLTDRFSGLGIRDAASSGFCAGVTVPKISFTVALLSDDNTDPYIIVRKLQNSIFNIQWEPNHHTGGSVEHTWLFCRNGAYWLRVVPSKLFY
jgi:hypothetical protein